MNREDTLFVDALKRLHGPTVTDKVVLLQNKKRHIEIEIERIDTVMAILLGVDK